MASKCGFIVLKPLYGGFMLECWASGICQLRQFFLVSNDAIAAYLSLVV